MSNVHREELKVVAERAVLVSVQLPNRYVDRDDPFGEIRSLTQTAGAEIVGELSQRRNQPLGRTYLGKGKVEELAALVQLTSASLIIFDNDLSPSQIKAIELATSCKVIDRSELILDIFANRAATHMAKLQVEIAQLEYTYPRLRAMWDHLGQVVGGAPIGIGTRGPGEQQLEIDRRLVQRRLKQLRNELEGMQQRRTREVAKRNADHFTVGLVGYTNAGKSTLFNRLTERGGAFAHDKLFATLSTRIEEWNIGGGNSVLLSDTVGFIRELPHHLVASFRSTLEETVAADLLLIVLDVSDSQALMQLETVQHTLDEIGATSQPRLLLLNKLDAMSQPNDALPWLNRCPDAILISALTGNGLDELSEQMLARMIGPVRTVRITLPIEDSRSIAFLEKRTDVLDRQYMNGQATFQVRIGRRQVDQLLTRGAHIMIDDRSPHDAIDTLWGSQPWSDVRQEAGRHVQIHTAESEDMTPTRTRGDKNIANA